MYEFIALLGLSFLLGYVVASLRAGEYIRNGDLLMNVPALHRAADHIEHKN